MHQRWQWPHQPQAPAASEAAHVRRTAAACCHGSSCRRLLQHAPPIRHPNSLLAPAGLTVHFTSHSVSEKYCVWCGEARLATGKTCVESHAHDIMERFRGALCQTQRGPGDSASQKHVFRLQKEVVATLRFTWPRASHSCMSVWRLNGSKLVRTVPLNNTGSYTTAVTRDL